MTNLVLIEWLTTIFQKFKTVYMWGAFGGLVTDKLILQKTAEYPKWYTPAKQQELRNKIGKNYFAFDCVGLIKAILWGWTGDTSKPHGGAKYTSNNTPDIDANEMINRCIDVSSDFSKIEPGEAVWRQGHIGIYIGNGKVIECTTAWGGCVQMTACLNIGPIKGMHGRKWTKHGKLPYIEYVSPPKPKPKPEKPKDKLEISPTVKPVKPVTSKPSTPNPNYRIHKVVKGDSLWHLALTYLGNGNRYKEIKILNNLTGDTIKLNQLLKIPPK